MFEITYDNSTPYYFKSAFIELKLLHADHLIDTTPVSCFIRYGEKNISVCLFISLSVSFRSTDRRRSSFPKEQLFERIWGYDSLGDISTVTVHIRKIKEKIEVDPSNPEYIETIWGVGYRFKK